MPPKVDVKTLAGKMENAVQILYELVEEFEVIFSVKPELKTLEAAFNQIGHLCPEMNASIVSEYFMSYWAFRYFHILHI